MTFTGTRPEGNVIDTRDLISWREWCMIGADAIDEVEDEDERADVEAINAIEEEVSDFPYGATLIHEDAFTAYARELADDIGTVDKDASWPLTHIDWNAAAEALKADYTEVEWDGRIYLVRA